MLKPRSIVQIFERFGIARAGVGTLGAQTATPQIAGFHSLPSPNSAGAQDLVLADSLEGTGQNAAFEASNSKEPLISLEQELPPAPRGNSGGSLGSGDQPFIW